MTDAEVIRAWRTRNEMFRCEPMNALLTERGCYMFRQKHSGCMGSAANRTRTEIREHVCWGCERNPSTEAPKPVGVFRTLNVGGGKVAHTTMQQCRFNAGLTMIDVAEILHIDPRIYSQYERGERIPARGHILKLIKLFGLPWEELKQ